MVPNTVNGSNQAGRFILCSGIRGGLLYFPGSSSSQGRPAPYKSITYHTVLMVMFHYSVVFSRVGSTQGCKGQAVVVAVADGFIIGTLCVDFTISNECILKKKYAHDTAPLDECSVTACISTAHSAGWLSLVARNLQYLTLTPSGSSSTLSTPI